MVPSHLVSLLSTSSLLLGLSSALKNTTIDSRCWNNAFNNGYNASGSVTIPGFQINSNYPPSKWTFTRFVSSVAAFDSDDVDDTTQVIALKTSPVQNLLKAPYRGCVIVIDGLQNPNGLTSSCETAMMSKVRRLASSMTSTSNSTLEGQSDEHDCSVLFGSLAYEPGCVGQWFATVYSELTHSHVASNSGGSYNPFNCSLVNPGNTNASTSPWPSWGGVIGESNAEGYAHALKIKQPVAIAAWQPDGKWSDARLMHVPVNVVEKGSLTAGEAEKVDDDGGSKGKKKNSGMERLRPVFEVVLGVCGVLALFV